MQKTKIFFLIVFLVILLTLLNNVNAQDINQEYILNYLDNRYSTSLGNNDIGALQWIIDSYDILGVTIPNRNEAIQLFNSKQNDSGCWFEKTYHYVPNTAQFLMIYNRTGVKPAKSLDPFFSTVDTWKEVKADVLKYDGGNYWGGLWGYVTSYIVYKGEAPPWTPEFLNETIKNFDSWAYNSHQRTHLVMNLYALNLSVPRVDEVVLATLNDQGPDGNWSWSGSKWNLRETVFNIFMLGMLRDQTTVDKSLIDSAIARGTEYVKSCYNTTDVNGKTYGFFYPYFGNTYADTQATALGTLLLLNPTSDVWSRWFALPKINKTEVDNSLDYYRSTDLKNLGVHNTALYVISKSFLMMDIPNKQDIIDFFDSAQQQDGSWISDGQMSSMFITNRVLTAYYILDATPKKSLDPFFANYDTWAEAKDYMFNTGSKDARNIYHVIFAWVLYNRTYPPWLNDFFNEVEKDLTWTTSTDSHKRTHILYSYVIARRQFPNLDGIIDETIREQSTDGNWTSRCLDPARPIYCTSIQLSLLQEIIKLYPNHLTAEIQNSIDRSRSWIYSTYNTTTINGEVMGYFGNYENIENSLMSGIMATGVNGLMDANVDMTFEDLVQLMKQSVILTDKQNYNPGEIVHITGNKFSSGVDASLQINNQSDAIKFVDQDVTDINGDFSLNYKIPYNAITGIYTIYASSPNEFAQTTFNVLGGPTTTSTLSTTSTSSTTSTTRTTTSTTSSTSSSTSTTAITTSTSTSRTTTTSTSTTTSTLSTTSTSSTTSTTRTTTSTTSSTSSSTSTTAITTSTTSTTSTSSSTSITTTIPRNTKIRLYLNKTEGNFYYLNNTYANFTVWVNCSGTVNLTTNITGWNVFGESPFTQIVLLNATQNNTYYNITGYFPGNVTHDSSSQTYYTIVYVTVPTTTTTIQVTTTQDGGGGATTTTIRNITTTILTTSTTTPTTTISKTTTTIITTTTIPSKKEISELLLMLGIGIIIILIIASLIIIIKSVHWSKGTVQKELIILMIAIVLIIFLISLLPIQDRKGVKGLSILDWFIKLWEWIFPPPKVAIVYPFQVSAQILDSNHNPTIYISLGQQYYVNASITNLEQEDKTAKFIVQIKDSIGQVIDDISSSSLTLNPGQTEQLEVSYTAPDIIGDYTAQIFVWTDLASRRGFALTSPLDLVFSVVSQITTTSTITTTTIPLEINRGYILNYLNYTFNDYLERGDIFGLTWTIDSYDILGVDSPNRAQAIEFLNSKQSDEGTWHNGTNHYVPITAQILMLYNRSGVNPPKSLDPFFSTIDTWKKVNVHVNTYNKGNYWGGLWGYVNCYVVYKHEAPPWTQEFLNEANVNFSTWVYSNHFRTHLIGNLLSLGEPIPRIDEVVNITLQQQKPDGSWDNGEAETVFMIQVLRFIRNQTSVDKSLIDSAINRGLEYVKKCYRTIDYQGKTYGGFSVNASDQNILPRETSQGIWILLNPNSDIWSRWFVKYTNVSKSHSYIMDMPVFPEDTVPKPLQEHPEVVFGWFPWSHGICYDENNEFLRYHMSLSTNWIYFTLLFKGSTYRFNFDLKNYDFSNGILTLVNGSTRLIVDYHVPHNVTLVYGSGYLTFNATYRGAPLWYSKTLDPNDMLIVPESNGRFGGYDAPIKIVGKYFDGTSIKKFNGYGDWEHVWFLGGGWSGPLRLWMILNDEKYYGAVAELKYPNGTLAWRVGRFGEAGGTPYVFDEYQWSDDGKALPLFVELKGNIRDAQGNIKGFIDLKTDPQKAGSISSIWTMYENISGNVLGDTFRNGTAWAEIRKAPEGSMTVVTTTTTITTTNSSSTTSTISSTSTIPVFQPLFSSIPNDESTLYDVVDGKLYFAYFGYDPPSGLVKINTSTNEATLIGEDKTYRWTAWKGFYDQNDKKLWFAGEYYDPTVGQLKGTIFQYDPFSGATSFVRHTTALEAWGITSYSSYLAYGQIWNKTMYGVPKSTWTNANSWIKKEVTYDGAIDFANWKGKLYGIALNSSGKIKIFDAVTLGEISSFTDLLSSGGGDVLFTTDKVSIITVDINKQVWLHESNDLVSWIHTSLSIPFLSSLNPNQVYRFNLISLNGKLLIFKSITTWTKGSTDGNTEVYLYDGISTSKIGLMQGYAQTKPILYNNFLYLATSYPNYIYKISVSELGA